MRFRFKPFFLCFLYAVALTAGLLYFRFPAAEFKKYCSGYVESLFPGIDCKIGSLSYNFPLTLRVDNVQFIPMDDPENVLFESKRLSVIPHLKYPVTMFSLSGDMYGGTHSSELSLGEKEGALSLTDLQVKDFDLTQFTLIQEELGRKFSGSLSFTGEFSGDISDLLGGTATGKAVIKKGRMELLQPILSLQELDVKNAEFDFAYNEQELSLENGLFSGKELKGSLSGIITMESQWPASELDLKGELNVESALFAGNYRLKTIVSSLQKRHKQAMLPFNVSGLMADPEFRFGK